MTAQALGTRVELIAGATAALASLRIDLSALNAAAAGLPGAPDPVHAALINCSYYSVQGSIPLSSSGPDPRLEDQATSVARVLQSRVDATATVDVTTASTADVIDVLTTVFGADFVVLPRFTPSDSDLQSAFSQSSNLVASDPQATSRWLLQLAHVRPGISRLDASLTLAQVARIGGGNLGRNGVLRR